MGAQVLSNSSVISNENGPSLSDNFPFDDVLKIGPSDIHGFGLFARRAFKAGEAIARLDGDLVRDVETETYPNAIGIGPDTWVDPGPPFSLINHSCDPTSAFGPKRFNYALRDIAAGEEITIDYSTTEVDPDWTLPCICNASNCRRILGAIQISFPANGKRPKASPLFLAIWHRLAINGPRG